MGEAEPRLVILVTSPGVPAGCLTWDAWSALRAGAVCTATPDHPQLPALVAAGVAVEELPDDAPPSELARLLIERAQAERPAVWLAAPGADPTAAALRDAAADDVAVEVIEGTPSLVGGRLLDAVAVMDRLRSPGGCPWDAEQTHTSLGKYLLEEAYEAYEAIEDGDLDALRDEIGDVLLQVLFHARVASERAADDPDAPGWDIDAVAGGLVDKLVRRHPHVFGDTSVRGADDVQRNWDALKAAEKEDGSSSTHGVALGQPSLALAAKLQKRATGVGLPADLLAPALGALESPDAAVASAAGAVEEHAAEHGGDVVDAVGELLFAAVALAREHGVDAESALRGYARRFRDQLVAAEAAAREAGRDPAQLTDVEWRELWG